MGWLLIGAQVAIGGGGLQGGGLSGGGANTTIPGTSTANCFSSTGASNTVVINVGNNGGIDFGGDGCGTALSSATPAMRWNGASVTLTGGAFQVNNSSTVNGTPLVAYNIAIAGDKFCLANGTDCVNDSSGIPIWSNGLAHDTFLLFNDPVTIVGTTGDIMITGPTLTAATIQDVNYAVPILGGGTGSLVTKLSSAAAGGGTVFATCTIACNATAGTTGTCTINTAAIPVSTTLHYAITTACTTADVQNNVMVHATE